MTDVIEQERVVAALGAAFPGSSVIDRRDNPSYGYRAVHIIAMTSGKPIEIQVRSSLQHLWAELSEKSSDVLDPTIKYGGGTDSWRSFLTSSSEAVASYEELETTVAEAVAAHEELEKVPAELLEHHEPDQDLQEMRGKLEDSTRTMVRLKQRREELRGELVSLWNVIANLLSGATSSLDERRLKGQKQ